MAPLWEEPCGPLRLYSAYPSVPGAPPVVTVSDGPKCSNKDAESLAGSVLQKSELLLTEYRELLCL